MATPVAVRVQRMRAKKLAQGMRRVNLMLGPDAMAAMDAIRASRKLTRDQAVTEALLAYAQQSG